MSNSLTTKTNINPYNNDFDTDKQFNQILFKPAVAVQARELTQLQSILQEQIRRFGNNIFREGTIIDGCAFSYNDRHDYVKIKDNNSDNNLINLDDSFIDYVVKSSSGVEGVIDNVINGLESQAPNLKTIYIGYNKTGTGGEKTFQADETLSIYNGDTLVMTVTAASADVNAIGHGFTVTCSDGIIFSKGHFLNIKSKTVIVSNYNDVPDQVSVGFDVSESIVTSDVDNSLLDNAAGFNNENAPGADRLKLSPFLISIPTADATTNANFLSIMDFQAGLPIAKRTTTQYNAVSDELARRTNEESGSYTVNTNDIGIESPVNIDAFNRVANANISASSQFELTIGPGLHYVNGYRTEQLNTTRIQIPRANNINTKDDVTISTGAGQYILINEYLGTFKPHEATIVDLYDTAAERLTNSTAIGSTGEGTKIGTARVKAIEFDQDGEAGQADGQYRLYIFDIKMNEGQDFKNVRGVFVSGGIADIVLTDGDARIHNERSSPPIYDLEHAGLTSARNCEYIYRTSKTTSNASSNTIDLSADTNTVFPYASGDLNETQKRDFIVIAKKTVAGITNNHIINSDDISIEINSDRNSAAIDISGAYDSGQYNGRLEVIHNLLRQSVSPINKNKKEGIFIRIDTSSINIDVDNEPICLGFPDVIEITNVYKGDSNWDYDVDDDSNSNEEGDETNTVNFQNVTNSFILKRNDHDEYYGLSEAIKKKSLTLATGDRLVFELKLLSHGTRSAGQGFYTVSSYRGTDGNPDLDSPYIYTSEKYGDQYDLRNAVDFRPAVSNTAAQAITSTGASINPSSVETFAAGDLFLAAPSKEFICNIEYSLPRIDRIIITEAGYIDVLHGTYSQQAQQPLPPPIKDGSLSLGIINIPPFPSRTPSEAIKVDRQNESIMVVRENSKRYTMEDISSIDRRLKNIEYYTTLNTLEQQTADLVITDKDGNDRFKAGILVDTCSDFNTADTDSDEFKIALDSSETSFTPKFKQRIINLKHANNAGCIHFTDFNILTPAGQEQPIIEQTVATDSRTCTENFYKFNGVIKIDPSYDPGYSEKDIPNNPIVIDTISSVNRVFKEFPSTYPLTKVSSGDKAGSETGSSYTSANGGKKIDVDYSGWRKFNAAGGWNRGGWSFGAAAGSGHGSTYRNNKKPTSSDVYDEIVKETKVTVKQNINIVGDFVRDVQFNPFMRAKTIKIVATGLRPETKHYFFFDEQNVNEYVRRGQPTVEIEGKPFTDNPKNVRGISAAVGDNGVMSDSSGRLYAIFKLPKGKFNIGDRQLVIMDQNDITEKDIATSKAQIKYSAYNYYTSKTGLTIATRPPEVDVPVRNDVDKAPLVPSDDYDKPVETTYVYDSSWGDTDRYLSDSYSGKDGKTYTPTYPYNVDVSVKYTSTSNTTINGDGDLTNNPNEDYYDFYKYFGSGRRFGGF